MSEMHEKIMAVIERLGATEMAVEIIVDIVVRGIGKTGGRPPKPKPVIEPEKPVTKLDKPVIAEAIRVSSDPGSSLLLFSPESSKPDPIEIVDVMEVFPSVGEQKAPSAPNVFHKVLRQFGEIWRTRYGVYYEPTAADRNQLGRLLKSLNPGVVEELPRAFRAYLGDLSPYVAQQMRHSLRFFCTSGGVNTYRANAPILSEKEARSVAAGDQWLEMSNGTKR